MWGYCSQSLAMGPAGSMAALAGFALLLPPETLFCIEACTPAGREFISLPGQRKRTKREATPFPRPADILSAGFVCGGWAFRQHILCWRKGECVLALAPAGLVIHHPPLHRGPESQRASCAPEEHALEGTQHLRTRCPRPFRGPCGAAKTCGCIAGEQSEDGNACPKARRQSAKERGALLLCSGHPAFRSSGKLRCSNPFQNRLWFRFSRARKSNDSRPQGMKAPRLKSLARNPGRSCVASDCGQSGASAP